MERKNNRKGFTIVELVITIAVIGVLTAILVPTFIGLTQKANEASDNSLVTNLNKALAIHEVQPDDTKNVTPQDAIDDLYDEGYRAEVLVTKSEKTLVWCDKDNRFHLATDTGVEKLPDGATEVDCWGFYKSMPQDQRFSIYAVEGWTGNAENLTVGFDAGVVSGIESVSYVGASSQKVVIRTNSAKTTLTINAEHDTVNHYGNVGKVDAQKIDMNCYNEFGKAAYIKVTEGKVVAKDGGEIAVVFANNTDSSKVAVAKESNGIIKKGLTTVEVVDANNFADYGVHLEYSADGTTPYTAETIEATGALSVASETGVQPQGMEYIAVVNSVGFNSLHEAIAAANAGDTVSLLKDDTDNTSKGKTVYYSLNPSELTAALIIDKNITINGFNHTFRTTCSSGMAITASNITVDLNDIVIIATGATSPSAIYFGQDITNTTLNVAGSNLQGKYAVKSGNGSNHLSLSFKDTIIEGWAAFTIRSSHSTINLTDCDLWGENDAAPHPSNGYATIVFDGADYSTSGYSNTSPYDGNPGQCGSNNVMNIVNTKVGATSLTSNGQQWLSLQYGPRGNSIIVDSSSVLSYATSINCTSEAESSSNTVKVGNNTIIPSN